MITLALQLALYVLKLWNPLISINYDYSRVLGTCGKNVVGYIPLETARISHHR